MKADANRHSRFELPSRRHCTSVTWVYILHRQTARAPDPKGKWFWLTSNEYKTPLPYLLDQIFNKRLEQRVGIVRIGSNRLGRPDLQ